MRAAHLLRRVDVVADAGRQHVADEERRIVALARRQRRQRLRHVRTRGVGEHHALGNLSSQRHHLLPQRGDDDRRKLADPFHRAQLLDEGARVAERLADRHAHALMARRVRHADAEAEAAAGDLVHERGTLREVQHRARVDRRDGGAERDALGVPGHRLALRHVAEHAGRVDAGEAASLDVAREVDGQAAAAGDGNEGDGGKGHGVPVLWPADGFRCRLLYEHCTGCAISNG